MRIAGLTFVTTRTVCSAKYRYVKKGGRIGCVIPRRNLQRGIDFFDISVHIYLQEKVAWIPTPASLWPPMQINMNHQDFVFKIALTSESRISSQKHCILKKKTLFQISLQKILRVRVCVRRQLAEEQKILQSRDTHINISWGRSREYRWTEPENFTGVKIMVVFNLPLLA